MKVTAMLVLALVYSMSITPNAIAGRSESELQLLLTKTSNGFRIAIRNNGRQEIYLNKRFSIGYRKPIISEISLRVEDEHRNPIKLSAKPNIGMPADGDFMWLHPGDEFSHAYDIDLFLKGYFSLKPGKYFVTAVYHNAHKVDMGAYDGPLSSNSIEIDVK